jgi:hypothetical protein
VRELEHREVPLPEVEQADHPDDVERLDGDDAGGEPDQPVFPRRREGEHRRQQHDRRLDAVAAGLDGDGEPVGRAAEDLAGGDDTRIEQRDQPRGQPGQRVRPGHDQRLLGPRRQLGAEERGLEQHEQDEKAQHRGRFYRSLGGPQRGQPTRASAGFCAK